MVIATEHVACCCLHSLLLFTQDQMSNDLWDTQLRNAIEATKTLTSFYLAFNHFKDFPQEDVCTVNTTAWACYQLCG